MVHINKEQEKEVLLFLVEWCLEVRIGPIACEVYLPTVQLVLYTKIVILKEETSQQASQCRGRSNTISSMRWAQGMVTKACMYLRLEVSMQETGKINSSINKKRVLWNNNSLCFNSLKNEDSLKSYLLKRIKLQK